MTDKELIRVLTKEVEAGRKWMRLAYNHPDDEGKTEPQWIACQKAMAATDKAKEAKK